MHISNNNPSPENGSRTQTIVCPVCSQKNSVDDILCKKCKKVLPNTVVEVKSRTVGGSSKVKTLEMKNKPNKSSTKSYKNSLITFLSLAVGLGALLFCGVAYYRNQIASTQQEIAREGAEAKSKTVMAAQNLEQYIGRHYLQVQEMAASPFLSDRQLWSAWSIDRKKEYFQNNFVANSDGMDSYVVIDAKTGDTVFSGGTGTKTKNNKHLDYYQQVIEFKKPVVIPRRKSTKTGISYIYMAAPSFDEQGNLLFVTRTRIRFEDIQAEIAASFDNLNSIFDNSKKPSEFFLVDEIGRVIVAEDPEILERHINKVFPVAESMREEDVSSVEIVQSEGINNSDSILSYTPIVEKRGLPELNWGLVTATKVD